MSKRKRWLSLVLCFALLLLILTGCSSHDIQQSILYASSLDYSFPVITGENIYSLGYTVQQHDTHFHQIQLLLRSDLNGKRGIAVQIPCAFEYQADNLIIITTFLDLLKAQDDTFHVLLRECRYPADDKDGASSAQAVITYRLDTLTREGTLLEQRHLTLPPVQINLRGGVVTGDTVWYATDHSLIRLDPYVTSYYELAAPDGFSVDATEQPMQALTNGRLLLLGKEGTEEKVLCIPFDSADSTETVALALPKVLHRSQFVEIPAGKEKSYALLWNETGVYQWNIDENLLDELVKWENTEIDATRLRYILATEEGCLLAVEHTKDSVPVFHSVDL